MKTLILYASKYGACKKITELLQTNACTCCDIQNAPPLEDFDVVVLGSCIYFGQINATMKSFLKQHEKQLQTKPLYLFICGMDHKEDHIDTIFKEIIPNALLEHATCKLHLGGCLDFSKMNFFERTIIKSINKKANLYDKTKKQSYIDLLRYDEIKKLDSMLASLSSQQKTNTSNI